MSTTSYSMAISKLDERMLRDIGARPDGSLDERDPRVRRRPCPVGPIDRVLGLFNLPVAGMLYR